MRKQPDRAPPFVVTGCGRSGTKFTATVFAQLGFRCGHEEVFVPTLDRFRGFGEAQGDSSTLAVPFLDQLERGTLVLHQVRHPLDVIRSYRDIAYFKDPPRWSLRTDILHPMRETATALSRRVRGLPEKSSAATVVEFVRFNRRHCPVAFTEDGLVARSARYYIEWNKRAESASGIDGLDYVRYQVERLDAALVRDLTTRLGGSPSSDVEAALASVPKDTNTKAKGKDLTWDEVPSHLREELMEMARSYGYSTATDGA